VDNCQAVCETPEDTFDLGRRLGASLSGGEVVLLHGGLGAGKTLFTKGIVHSLGFDTDEVTSPSFTLVNLYKTERFDVYHVDLWRLEAGPGIADAVGLDDILEDEAAVLVIEWAERLGRHPFDRPVIDVSITGDGESPREIRMLAE
jgi:tRNA threonylcarbamoyladenosine biosynthesis protein TsaE